MISVYTVVSRFSAQGQHAPSCLFCGEADNIVTYKEKKICKACLEEMKKI